MIVMTASYVDGDRLTDTLKQYSEILNYNSYATSTETKSHLELFVRSRNQITSSAITLCTPSSSVVSPRKLLKLNHTLIVTVEDVYPAAAQQSIHASDIQSNNSKQTSQSLTACVCHVTLLSNYRVVHVQAVRVWRHTL